MRRIWLCRSYEGDRRPRAVFLVSRTASGRRNMFQFKGSAQTAIDYNSTIICALELSGKKWVLAVQLPGVSRHFRHVLDALGDGLVSFIERLKARCAAGGREITRVILTHEAGAMDFGWRASLRDATSRFTSCSPRASRWIVGRDGQRPNHRRRDVAAHLDGLAKGRATGVFDGSDPERGR